MKKRKLKLAFNVVKTATDLTLEAKNKGIRVGRITFNLHEIYNNPELIMIFVEPEYRRRGIATKMLMYLQSKYGDNINWGSKTTDGTYLYKSFYKV